MEVHSDPAPSESDAFHTQSEALFLTVFPRQSDSTAGRHDAMPGEAVLPLQRSHGEPGGAGESRRFGHLAVGDHPPARHLRDDRSESTEGRHGSRPRSGAAFGVFTPAVKRNPRVVPTGSLAQAESLRPR